MELTKKKTKREEMMAYLTATATADSESDVQALLRLFNPVNSRAEMGGIYEETLGYNPITHYDIQDVIAVLDDAMDHVSSNSVSIFIKHKDEIVEKAMQIYEEKRLEHIKEAVALAMLDFLPTDDASALSLYLTGNDITLGDFDDGDDDDDELTAGMSDEDLDDNDDIPSLKDLDDDDEEFNFDEGDDDDE